MPAPRTSSSLSTLVPGALLLGAALLLTPAPGVEGSGAARLGFPVTPTFRGEGRWTTVPAFPNVTFRNPVVLEPEPGTDRLLIGELEGLIVAVSDRDRLSPERTVVLDLTGQTQGGFDSGLLGLAFHPEYGRDGSPNRDHVYVFYSWNDRPVRVGRPEPTTLTWTRVSRFTMDRAKGTLRPESEQVLIHQRKRMIFHVGGGMFFHPRDGFLYIAMGDEGAQQDGYRNSQRIDLNLFSGVLRIDVDQRGGTVSHPIRRQPRDGTTAHYHIPSDNPFVGTPGALEEFYAIGLRSPHRMTHDPVDDLAWIGEIGQARREEIEVLRIGRAPQNFQWAVREGGQPGFVPAPERPLGLWTGPVWEYGRDQGRSVIGGYVYRGRRHPSLAGKYLCADFANGRIWALAYAVEPERITVTGVELLASGPGFRNYHGGVGGITSFGRDHAGELLLLRHGLRTRIEQLAERPPGPGNVPATLSATGLFADLATLQPAPGLVPYEVIAPQWMNGARARRWIALPEDRRITFHPDADWRFPPGTVLVQQVDWMKDTRRPEQTSRLETRVLVAQDDGGFYGLNYRWDAAGRDATLVENDDERATLDRLDEKGARTRVLWAHSSTESCSQCHSQGAGHVLGLKTRQLNRPVAGPDGAPRNQLEEWARRGMLDVSPGADPARNLRRHAAIEDPAAAPEAKVRAYLDANCAHCHNSAPIPAAWRGNSNLPLPDQLLVFGPLVGPDSGGHRHVVAPRDPDGSDLFHRVSGNVIGQRMPPLESDSVDRPFVALLREWIDGLPRPETTPPVALAAELEEDGRLLVRFNEAVRAGDGAGGAERAAAYRLSGAEVLAATLATDRRTVTLRTSPLAAGRLPVLRVEGVADRADTPNLSQAQEVPVTRAPARLSATP